MKKMKKMGKRYGEVDKRRKQLMVENQLIVDRMVDSSTSKPRTKKPSTRKPATSNHPAFALLLLGVFLLLALACLPSPALAATPITTCTELQNIRNNLGGDYYLANDIDCSCTSGWNGGAGFMPIGNLSSKFTGTFDGKGYKITHLYINRPSTNYVGLFGFTVGSEIKNVGLEEVDVRGNQMVGGLVGDNCLGIITNSSSSGTVNGSSFSVGGLVGYNDRTITNSSSSGSVNGDWEVGGLVGDNRGTITNSYSSGSVSGSSSVGGLVGFNFGIITNSYSSGSVSGSKVVGGLVGNNFKGTITNSYSSGSVTSSGKYVGGLVGDAYDGTITNSYSSGSVNGYQFVGGLVGVNFGIITNSYSSGSVSGKRYVGGLVGFNVGTITNSYYPGDDITCTGCDNTIGNTIKANLQNETWLTTAPNDWDFDTIWGIVEHVTYPYLRWQYMPKITSFAPPSPVNDTVCNWRTFNVTVDQTANVSWYLNNSLLHTNESIMEANYTLHAEFVGDNNVSAVATNVNGTDMQTWVWNVAIPLNCTCGDICVNETGWWRADADFNASSTPIQHAIDNAIEGDTICVKDGTYTENVNVRKRLTIRSENGSASTIVNAADSRDHVFNVSMDYVNISGFTVKGATDCAGIYLDNVDQCDISHNNASDNWLGIFLVSSSSNTITGNKASSGSEGISLWGSGYNTITNNIASNNRIGGYGRGISLVGSCRNTLTNNTMGENGQNFYIYGKDISHFIQDIDASNTVDGRPIYYRLNQQNQQVPDNAGFVGIVNSRNITVSDTTNYDGILFANVTNSRVENVNASIEGTYGIRLFFSSDNTLSNNTVSNDNDCSFFLYESSSNRISNNIVSNNRYSFVLDHSSNNMVSNNIVSNSGTGFFLTALSNNMVSNNVVSNSGTGFFLEEGSNNNMITNNTASNNSDLDFYSDMPYSSMPCSNKIKDLTISSYRLSFMQKRDTLVGEESV